MPDVVLGTAGIKTGTVTALKELAGTDSTWEGQQRNTGATPRKSAVELAKERARDWCSRQRNCIHKMRRVTESMVSAQLVIRCCPRPPSVTNTNVEPERVKQLPQGAFVTSLWAHQTFMNSPNCIFVPTPFLCPDHLNCM